MMMTPGELTVDVRARNRTETPSTLIRKITITNRVLRIPKIHKLDKLSRSYTSHTAYGEPVPYTIRGRWSVCGLYTVKDRFDIRTTWDGVDCGNCLRRKEKYHHGKASSQVGGSEEQ